MRVSQKIIIRNAEGNILALKKSFSDSTRPHTWDLPGGQVEEGEHLEASARREVREETGLEVVDMRFVHADARNARDGLYWIVLFSTARIQGAEDVILSDEHEAFEWLTREEFARRESSERIQALMSGSIPL